MKHCLRFCLLDVSENIDNTIKDIKVSYVQIPENHCHEMWP